MLISFILGTRPEIIKLAPMIRELENTKLCDYHIIHTNQHYDYKLDAVFFKELELPKPEYNLGIGSGTHGAQTGKMLIEIEKVLMDTKPDWVVVQGDTNTVLAGTLAAIKLHIPVGHVEAGLRSFDRSMPEESNRIIADHVGTMLFAPTKGARKHLTAEGIFKNVFVTGNTVVDALFQHIEIAKKRPDNPVNAFGDKFILATIHRDSNTDDPKRLEEVLLTLGDIARESGHKVFLPAHPRTVNKIRDHGLQDVLDAQKGVAFMEPLGYLDFLLALSRAALVVTDSGGVQEEACILHVPTVTIRTTTERPETIDVGANILAPNRAEAVTAARKMMSKKVHEWNNPFGDGKAGRRILALMLQGPE